MRLPPAAPGDQGLAMLHEALAPTWEQLLEMTEQQDYTSTEGNLPFLLEMPYLVTALGGRPASEEPGMEPDNS